MKPIKIKLKKEERGFLKKFVRDGTKKARAITRANVLLLADEGYNNDEIAGFTRVHRQSIWRIKKRYNEEGIDSALKEKPRPGQPVKYDRKKEAEVIALACTNPPNGSKRWTLKLLTKSLKKKKGLKTINRESIRLILKKTRPSHG